jgi:hypothetical protein
MAEAPRLVGGLNATLRLALAVVMDVIVGADGYGLTNSSAELTNELAFTSLTAATLNRIVSPGVKPGTEAEVEVETPSLTHTQVWPPLREY